MQSTTVLDIPEGDLVITDADYAYRNLSHDRYRVTATMAGPGQKSGTIVFYNTETKEVYKSVPLENVKSGQTVTAELINEKGYLSSVYSHLGAAILTGEESIDTIQPSPDDQEVKLIPKWFMTSSNESDVNSCPRDDRCPMAPFTDVDSQAWYHNGVHWAIEKGIMDGTGEKVFEPMNSSSRAMMVTILWRMEGSPVVDYNFSFKDVADGQWYSDAVRWAAANGIVNGYSEEIFAPEDLVTREQIVTILYRYALFKGMDVNVGENLQLNDFTDAGEIAEWAVDAFWWAVDLGIIQGMTNTTLSPKSSAVRAQVATMLMRYSSIVA